MNSEWKQWNCNSQNIFLMCKETKALVFDEFGELILSDINKTVNLHCEWIQQLNFNWYSWYKNKETNEKWNITTFTFLCSWNHVLNSVDEPKASQRYKTAFYKSKTVLCASLKKDKPLQKETEFTFINLV